MYRSIKLPTLVRDERDFYLGNQPEQKEKNTSLCSLYSTVLKLNNWVATVNDIHTRQYKISIGSTAYSNRYEVSNVTALTEIKNALDGGSTFAADTEVVKSTIKSMFNVVDSSLADCFILDDHSKGVDIRVTPTIESNIHHMFEHHNFEGSVSKLLDASIMTDKLLHNTKWLRIQSVTERHSKAVDHVLEKLSTFFKKDLSLKSNMLNTISVVVPLTYDFKTLLSGTSFEHKSIVSTVPDDLVKAYGKYINLLVTLVPSTELIKLHKAHKRAVLRRKEGKTLNYVDRTISELEDKSSTSLALSMVKILVTPVFKMSKAYSEYLTQSSPHSIPVLYMWINNWILATYGKNGTAYCGKVNTVKNVEYMTSVYDSHKYSELRRKLGLADTDSRADEFGTYVSQQGKLLFAPSSKSITSRSALDYETFIKKAIDTSLKLNEPLNLSRTTTSTYLHTENQVSLAQTLNDAKVGLVSLGSVPLVLDWNLNVLISANKTNLTKLHTTNLDGCSRPRRMTISSILSEKSPLALEKILNVSAPSRKRMLKKDDFKNTIPTKALAPIAPIYAFLLKHNKVEEISYYLQKAATELGKHEGVTTSDFDSMLSAALMSKNWLTFLSYDDFIEMGSISKTLMEEVGTAELASALNANQQRTLLTLHIEDRSAFLAQSGFREIIFNTALFLNFSNIWSNLVWKTHSTDMKMWAMSMYAHDSERYPYTCLEDVPFYYNHADDSLSDLGKINKLIGGLAFTLMLRDIGKDLWSDNSIVLNTTELKKPCIKNEPLLPFFDVIANQVVPLVTLIGEYIYHFQKYLDIGKDEKKRCLPNPEFTFPAIPGSHNLSLFPHQLKAHSVLDNVPEICFESISTGGGKCLKGDSLVPTSLGMLRLDEIWDMVDASEELNNFKPLDISILSVEGVGSTSTNNRGGVSSSLVLGLSETSFDETMTKHQSQDCISFEVQVRRTNAVYRRTGDTWLTSFDDGTVVSGLGAHKLWTYDLHTADTQFRPLEDLKDGDWCEKSFGYRLYSLVVPTFDTNVSTYSDEELLAFKSIGGKLPKCMTEDLATVLGYLVNEEYTTREYLQFNFQSTDNAEHFKEAYFSVFGISISSINQCFTIDRPIIVGFIDSLIINDTLTQHVPICIRQSPKQYQQAFLRALIDSNVLHDYVDDSRHTWDVSYTSSSYDLANQVRMMIEGMGVLTTLKVQNFSTGGKAVRQYIISVVSYEQYLTIFSTEIGFISSHKKRLLTELLTSVTLIPSLTAYGSIPCGPEAQRTYDILKSYKIKHSHDYPSLSTINKNGACSRLWVEILRRLLLDAPTEVKEQLLVNGELCDLWTHIVWMSDRHWIRVQSSKKTGRVEPVYDLSVPETKNYAFNGIYGHNTIIGITDIISLLNKGVILKPLVIAPHNLLSTWVDELHAITNGQYNVIPIETHSISRLTDDESNGGIGREAYIRLVRTAPINTIFLTSFSYVRQRTSTDTVTIGNVVKPIFPNIEFLKSFGFDYILIDEIHKLKNEKSLQHRAISTLTADPVVKFIRFASGTIISDKLMDVVSQTSLVDPTVFGTESMFIDEFSKDGTAVNLKDKSGQIIRKRMQDRCGMITAYRREWSWMLPIPVENIHTVRLSSTLQAIYDAILEEQIESLKSHPRIMNLLRKGATDIETDDLKSDIDKLVLSRLEQFIHDPMGDPVASKILDEKGIIEGDSEVVPPKVVKIKELLDTHFKTDTSKVLILTRNIRSALAIRKYLGKYVNQSLPYHAGIKHNLKTWLTDSKINILVAVEHSISTGYNLQIASRVIRVDSPWTPSELEQSFARIFRPDVGNKFSRDTVTLDWVLCNGTAEVAKFGRLISKIMRKTEYDEAGNPLYASLVSPDPISMSIDSLRNINELHQIKEDYINRYVEDYLPIVYDEFMEFKKKAIITDTNSLTAVPPTEMLINSKKLTVTPFIRGQEHTGINDWSTLLLATFVELRENKKYLTDIDSFVGQYVITEIGKGVIDKARVSKDGSKLSSVVVRLQSSGKSITVSPDIVHLVYGVPDTDRGQFESAEHKDGFMMFTFKTDVLIGFGYDLRYTNGQHVYLNVDKKLLRLENNNVVKLTSSVLNFLVKRLNSTS